MSSGPESQTERSYSIESVEKTERRTRDDFVTVESPLEIRVVHGPAEKRKGKGVSITMRTPGHDLELAAGFLFTEGLVNCRHDLDSHEFVGKPDEAGLQNTIRLELAKTVNLDTSQLQRHFYTTSSCGVCGKASLDAIYRQGTRNVAKSGLSFSTQLIHDAGEKLRKQQQAFDRSGGIHAAGLFDSNGELLVLREDVGRHNALDKLIGNAFLSNALPLTGKAIMVSGRTSFELVQKSVAAGAEVVIAVGAPSSLAVELAREFGVTLIGFANGTRFNIYSHGDRIQG